MYPASTEDLATVFRFLIFQETKEEPKKIQYRVRDLAENLNVP